MEKEEKIKCLFCKKRIVKQQEWKKDLEKKYCMTCISFLKYARGIEKAMKEQLEAIGIYDKEFWIEIRRKDPSEKILEVIGQVRGLKKFE